MVHRKGNADPPLVAGGSQRKSMEPDDLWAFLDEIEAPMWVDLTLESQFMAEDIEDAWFQSSHPFHQCSSHDLISMFSLSSEGKMKSPDSQQPHPRLPSSVSRSRGKHYRSRKWKGIDHDVISVNKHPIRILGGKKTTGLISKSDALHSNSTTSTLTTSKSSTKVATNSGDQTNSMDSKESHTFECNSGSTVTSQSSIRPKSCFGDSKTKVDFIAENTQHPSISEASRRAFGQTNGFLSAVRISLTKSCITRHASRVEVKDGPPLKDRKSSLSKSSVGSSYNPGSDLDNINIRVNEGVSKIRRESKDTTTVQLGNKKRNSSNVAKTTFSGKLQDRSSNLVRQWGGKPTATEYNSRGSKAKILHATAPRKPLWLHNVADPLKERVTTKSGREISSSKFSRATEDGKENNETGMNQNKKASTHATGIKDRNRLTDLKGKTKGKTQGRNPSKVISRVHFR